MFLKLIKTVKLYINGYYATKLVSTPECWATGFDIVVVEYGNEIWQLRISATRKEPKALFEGGDRLVMRKLRDKIIKRLNRVL